MSAPYSDPTFTWQPMKVADIKFSDGDDLLVYRPLEDITGLELANMMHLFATATLQAASTGFNHYDYPEFIERKGLMRHFKREAK